MMEGNAMVKWGNHIAYILIPFNISLPSDPLDHIRQAKLVVDAKKHSLEAVVTYRIGKFLLDLFGVKVINDLAEFKKVSIFYIFIFMELMEICCEKKCSLRRI